MYLVSAEGNQYSVALTMSQFMARSRWGSKDAVDPVREIFSVSSMVARRVTSRIPSWILLMLSVTLMMSLGRHPQNRSLTSWLRGPMSASVKATPGGPTGNDGASWAASCP